MICTKLKCVSSCVALAAFLMAAPSAKADLVTSADGVIPVYTVTVATGGAPGPVGNGVVLTFPFGELTTIINGVPVPPFVPTSFSSAALTIDSFVADVLATQYVFTQVGAFTETITLAPPFGAGGTATFALNVTQGQVDNSQANTLSLSGSKTLISQTGDTSVFDFSPFLNGGTIDLTLNVSFPAGFNFNTALDVGTGTTIGSGSFSQNANPTVIPEPTSLALMGLGLPVVGLYLVRRRRLAKAAA
jgi:hypothetical protein